MPKTKRSTTNGSIAQPKTLTLPEPTNPNDVKSVYANHMEITGSNNDVRLTFNEIIIDHGVTVQRRANVVTNLNHFFAMVQAINKTAQQIQETMKAAAEASAAEAKATDESKEKR